MKNIVRTAKRWFFPTKVLDGMDEIVPDRDIVPAELRRLCREGVFRRPTAGYCPGYVQANLVIVPRSIATDFYHFCEWNPQPCPLLEMLPAGDPTTKRLAVNADLRSDLPLYRVYRHGEFVEEKEDILDDWRGDFVSFLLGCSFTFESALLSAGLPVRHLQEQTAEGLTKNVPMYRTNILCRRRRGFFGAARCLHASDDLCPGGRSDTNHVPISIFARPPVHRGNPSELGIEEIDRPDWGDPVTIYPGEIPVFWACGVTPQAVLLTSAPEIAITHSPGHMFVSDCRDDEIDVISGTR